MVKERSVALCIILTLVTCGLYGIYWFVCMTDDVNALAGDDGTSGIMALILTLVTCGLYGLYWAYKMGDKLDTAKQNRGIPASNGGILYLILFLFGAIISYALIQNDINKLVA